MSAEILAQAERYLDQDELRAYRLLGEVEAAQQEVARRRRSWQPTPGNGGQEPGVGGAATANWRRSGSGWSTKLKRHALDSIKEAEGQFKEIVKRLQSGGESWGKLRQEFSRRQADLLAGTDPRPRA